MLFHIDLDAFFASVEIRDNPALAEKPVIIGATSNRGVVSTANYVARTFGIHSGMPLFKARRLCPDGVYLPGNFSKYAEASQQFLHIIRTFTPMVEKTSIDEAYLSFYGFEIYYPDLVPVAIQIKNRIQTKIGITATIGIATSKHIAKMASDSAKPNGLCIVTKGEEKKFLFPRLVQEIPGVGPKLTEKLQQHNIHTIGQLAQFPKTTLVQIFGKHGNYLHQVAAGLGTTKLTLVFQQKSIGRETTLPSDSNDYQFLTTLLLYLSHKIARDIRKKNFTGVCITIKLRDSNFVTKTHQKTLTEPTNQARVIYHIGKKLFDMYWKSRPLRLIGVSISRFDTNYNQLHLFHKKTTADLQIEKTLDIIRDKYGFLSVYPLSVARLEKVYQKKNKKLQLLTPSLSR